MKCVANISVDKDTCLYKCSGLLVTAYDRFEMSNHSKQFISKLSTYYWNYKGFHNFPVKFKSKCKFEYFGCKQQKI